MTEYTTELMILLVFVAFYRNLSTATALAIIAPN